MEEVQEYKTGVARIETTTLLNNASSMSEMQTKAFLYFVSKINHNNSFNGDIVVTVDFKDLVDGLNTFGIQWKKSKSNFVLFTQEAIASHFIILQDYELKGRLYQGQELLPLYQSIKDKVVDGRVVFEVTFNSKIKNALVDLSKFTRFYSRDFKHLSGGYTLDLFSLFSTLYENQAKYKDKVVIKYTLEELKKKLNIKENEYTVIKNFKARVLDSSIKQINQNTSIYVWYKNIKEGKIIIGFQFYIVNNYANSKDDYKPTQKEIGKLTIYEYEAYRILKNYGVIPGIIIKQIIPNLPKGVLNGFEDLFIKACVQDFEQNTNQKTAKGKTGAFVQWFCHNKVYSQDNDITFNRIRERVVSKFKTLSQEEHSERSSNTNLTVQEKYGEQAVIEF